VVRDYQYVRRRTIGIRIDQLWVIGPLLAFGMVVAIKPVTPNDLWWHLKMGQIISETGSVPTTNMFAWSLPADEPFMYGAWLGELLMYTFYRLGQLPLLIFLRTILAMAAFALVGYESYRRSGSWRIAGVTLTLAAAMSSNNMEIRPQIWAWLPFMGMFILLSAYARGQLERVWLLLCPVIAAFWVNVHGSFVLGLILVGIFFVGEVLKKLLKMGEALPWPQIRWILLVGVLCGLAILVNPRFLGTVEYVINLMTDAPSQELVVEWQSPAPNNYASIAFYISILILLAVLAYSRHRMSPTDLILIVAFSWLAWNGLRYVIWFGFAIMPLLAQEIKGLVGERKWLAVPPPNMLNLILVIVLLLPFLLVQPWFVSYLPLPQKYAELVLNDTKEGPLLTANTPVAAVEYLRSNPGGNLFNDMGYGSYLIWAVPEQGVFVDPRVELYPYEMWLDYIRIANGVHYNQLLEGYGADRMILDVEYQAELLAVLPDDPLWELEYEDTTTQIWRKRH
jgi:hypothetical protein